MGPQLFLGWYQMILDVFRCSQLFSDVHGMFLCRNCKIFWVLQICRRFPLGGKQLTCPSSQIHSKSHQLSNLCLLLLLPSCFCSCSFFLLIPHWNNSTASSHLAAADFSADDFLKIYLISHANPLFIKGQATCRKMNFELFIKHCFA